MLSFALLSFHPHLSFAFYVSPARMIRCLGEIETDVFLAYRPQPTDYILTSPHLTEPCSQISHAGISAICKADNESISCAQT